MPASFAEVGSDSVLMFPSFALPKYTELLELKPTTPDVYVERSGPYSAGADPILDAGIQEAVELSRHVTATPLSAPAVQAAPSRDFDPAAFPLPDVDELLDDMVAALGGAEALRAHSHLLAKGMVSIVDTPVEGTFELEQWAPMRLRSRASLGAAGSIETESDERDVKTYFREYRPFDGVRRPTQYVLDIGFQQQVVTLTAVSLR